MTEPLNAEEIEALRGALDRGGVPDGWDAHKWFRRLLATLDRDRAEATAAAEQRLDGLPDLVATAIVGLPNSGGVTWNEARAIGDRLLALLDTPPPASPRQGEEDEVEPCNIEPAFSQHEYAVDYCETHDRPADQCAPPSASPRQGEPVDGLREALSWALRELAPYSHAPECSPMACVCGYDKAHFALAASGDEDHVAVDLAAALSEPAEP